MYYYPNRPTLIPPDKTYIDQLENSGLWIAERKWNGDNVLINTDTMEFWNRYKQRHRFVPSPDMREILSKWPKGALINAELMNYQTKSIKNTIIVHCIMIWNGKPLIGKTWGDSRKIIEDHIGMGPNVKVSETFQTGFWDLFQSADGVEIEGIILKQPAGKLVFSATPIKDVSFMYKIRKPCKKYQF
jgi:hypothetical protein